MELNYRTFGKGFPLIILHGMLGSLDNWQTLGKKLAEEYMVYLVDQRNHGRSPHAETHTYPEMAADLAEDALNRQDNDAAQAHADRALEILETKEAPAGLAPEQWEAHKTRMTAYANFAAWRVGTRLSDSGCSRGRP